MMVDFFPAKGVRRATSHGQIRTNNDYFPHGGRRPRPRGSVGCELAERAGGCAYAIRGKALTAFDDPKKTVRPMTSSRTEETLRLLCSMYVMERGSLMAAALKDASIELAVCLYVYQATFVHAWSFLLVSFDAHVLTQS